MIKRKRIIAYILLFLLVSRIKVVASTKVPDNVELIGNAEGLVYISEEKYFLSSVGMLPGDKVSRQLNIENKYDVSYELFMKAERVTPKDKYDLLGKMKLKMTYNEELVYYGPIIKEDGEPIKLDLGLYKPADRKIMTAEVELDGTLTGNDYRNKEVEVNWIFTAEYRGGTFHQDDVSSYQNKAINSLVKTIAKTEDNNRIEVYFLLAGASLLVIILVLKKLKGSKEE